MFRFFRRHRFMQFKNSRITKYALYAIGEVILVVIGILIALQVNNWNEERKIKTMSRELLLELRSDLQLAVKDLERCIDANEYLLSNNRKVISWLENEKPYSPAMDTAFNHMVGWPTPHLPTASYESLKNKGLEIIDNKDLKDEIIELYDSFYSYLINDNDKTGWLYAETISFPIYNKYIRKDINSLKLARPNNYEDLVNNDEFLNMLHFLIHYRTSTDGIFKNYKQSTVELIMLLEDELNLN